MTTKPPASVIWFKRDLRIEDHAPLVDAARYGPMVALYVVEPDLWRQPDASRRHWHVIHDGLTALSAQLAALGGQLTIRIGAMPQVLDTVRHEIGSFRLLSHEETGNGWSYERDREVAAWCSAHSIDWREYPSHGVVRRLADRDRWAGERTRRMLSACLPAPNAVTFLHGVESHDLPGKDHPMFGLAVPGRTQSGGRSEGLAVLNSFLDTRCRRYMATISKPGISARHCSRLSTHIAFGTLSVREIEQATRARLASLQGIDGEDANGVRRNLGAFLSRLAWRCHFVQKLEQQPEIESRCMHPAFEGMRDMSFNRDYFRAWARGETGYPLIDAAMRSLIENGWITFRMRAMLVSFASYHLWLDWRQTAPYLARLFADYEPGIHYSQFQMQSGVTGINAVRIYNPVKQSLDHDPQGRFIRRYLPELRDVPDSFLHEPWRLEKPPKDYPPPIVDQEAALREARSQLARFRAEPGFARQADAVRKKLASRTRPQEASAERRARAARRNIHQLQLDLE